MGDYIVTGGTAEADSGDGDSRPIRYVEQLIGQERDEVARDWGEGITERVVYRASGLANCDRAFVAAAQGVNQEPPPADMLRVFNEGHEAEPQIRSMFEQMAGVEVVGVQDAFELPMGVFEGRLVVIRGHVDGWFEAGETATLERVLFEAKKFRASTWGDWQARGVEVHKNYPMQVSACMYGVGAQAIAMVGGLWGGDKDKERVTEIYPKNYIDPPVSYKGLWTRISHLEKLIANTGTVFEVACCVPLDYPCGYYKIHDATGAGAGDASDAFQLTGDAEQMATELAAVEGDAKLLKDQLSVLNALKKELTEKLREELDALGDDAAGAKKLVAGDWEITHVHKVIKEHVRKESVQDYFTVKARVAGTGGATGTGDVSGGATGDWAQGGDA